MTVWIVISVLVLLVLLYVAATYFFRFTFLRGDREPWSDNDNKLLFDRDFFESPSREQIEITSRDGLRLRAWLYDQGADVTVILFHGYRGGPPELSGIASRLYAHGMNVLLIFHRAHGISEGTYFTMGTREKFDAVDWAKEIARRKPEGRIVLFGWSMGGNTVMGAVGEELPENVCCAVEDCGYENLKDQILYSCKRKMPKLPAKRFALWLLRLYCQVFKGFSIDDPRSASLSRCKVPMLFIHGEKDSTVPYENLALCYKACAAKKLHSSYAHAEHVASCGTETERYFSELIGFIHVNCQTRQQP